MTDVVDSVAWLEPISAEQPCGEYLANTPFDDLRVFGQARSPEAPPEPDVKGKEREKARPPADWSQIKADALAALGKSKDLQLLAYLGTALLRTDGLPAFVETLTTAARWLETYWADVYPLVDEDAIARRNALNCFADPMAVVDRVWRIPLVESRQYGRFSLRDIDLATGHAPIGPNDQKPAEGAINDAFAEMPIDTLAALQQSVIDASAALTAIDTLMRAAKGPEAAPSFDVLSGSFARMQRALGQQLAARGKPADAAPGEAGGEAAAPAEAGAIGPIKSRQDAIRALAAVSDFFRRHEPSSPIPLFLDRATRLVSKDFLEVLADIAPDALSVARAAGGLKPDK